MYNSIWEGSLTEEDVGSEVSEWELRERGKRQVERRVEAVDVGACRGGFWVPGRSRCSYSHPALWHPPTTKRGGPRFLCSLFYSFFGADSFLCDFFGAHCNFFLSLDLEECKGKLAMRRHKLV